MSEQSAATKAAPEQGPEAFPAGLTGRWEAALGVCGIACGLLFALLFTHAFPYLRFQTTLTAGSAQERALEYARQAYPAAQAGAGEASVWGLWDYAASLLTTGPSQAAEERGVRWTVPLNTGARQQGTATLDRDGRLLNIFLPPSGPETSPRPAPESLTASARDAVQRLFGISVPAEAASIRTLPADSGQALVWWTLPAAGGRHRLLKVRFDGSRVVSASNEFAADDRLRTSAEWEQAAARISAWLRPHILLRVPVACLLLGVTLAVGFLRWRLYTKPSARWFVAAVFAVLAGAEIVVALYGAGSPAHRLYRWLSPLSLLFVYVVLCAVENLLASALPAQFDGWQKVFSGREWRTPALQVLRGCGLGAIYLAVHAALLAVLGSVPAAGPGIGWLGARPASFAGFALCAAILGTLLAWLMAGVPAACAWTMLRAPGRAGPFRSLPGPEPGGSHSSVLAAAFVAILWVAAACTVPGGAVFPLAPLFLFAALQGAFFAWTLLEFGALSMLASIFTVETWLLVFPAVIVFGATEAAAALFAMAPWFALLLLALLFAGRGLRPALGGVAEK